MSTLANSLAQQARTVLRLGGYDRHGGKKSRREQIEKACKFCDWAQQHCQVGHLGQLGGAHVIRYWRAHRDLADGTLYHYWLAFCVLWRFAGKAGKPPKPFRVDGVHELHDHQAA